MCVELETFAGDGACFDASPDEALYRYRLWRNLHTENRRENTLLFVMLNPSTALHDEGDPTIRRCEGFARLFGATRLEVVNLFAFRATDPVQLETFLGDVVGPENDEHITSAAERADTVVCAWAQKCQGGTFPVRKRFATCCIKAVIRGFSASEKPKMKTPAIRFICRARQSSSSIALPSTSGQEAAFCGTPMRC